jgi:protein-S-isoprenylcysteine O-methyltransferase Ste14
MYLGSFCAALGFAFLRNNVIALATAFIFLVPILVEIRLEDHELIKRGGDNHRNYIKSTGALFPRDIRGFFKLLFLGKGH